MQKHKIHNYVLRFEKEVDNVAKDLLREKKTKKDRSILHYV